MNRKIFLAVLGAMILAVGFSSAALACPGGMGKMDGQGAMGQMCPMCQMKSAGQCPMCQMMKAHKMKTKDGFSLKDKVFHKAKFLLSHQETLELTADQVNKIKTIKLAAKKDVIMKKAEIDIIALDIKAQVGQEQIDTKAVSALIDKKYEVKKAKAKMLVEAYASLKGVLTNEQKAKAKALWMKKDGLQYHGKSDAHYRK